MEKGNSNTWRFRTSFFFLDEWPATPIPLAPSLHTVGVVVIN
jgi:hypothetical protein